MIGLSDLIGYAILFVPMFLMHELAHIKSCGLRAGGLIHVDNFMLYVDTEFDKYNLSWYGGGVFSSIYMFLATILLPVNPFTFGFITLGWTNLIYGILEGYYHGINKWRYLVYATILLTCVVMI
jgi:hypothetical protein